MIGTRTLALGMAVTILAAACSAGGVDDGSELQESAASVAKGDSMLGDDRVADVLRKDTTKIPTNLAEVESLFKVGRECARPDSKEIFVLEETKGRLPDGSIIGDESPIPLTPRAVISGCNTGALNNAGTLANSFDMFIALVSDPEVAKMHNGDGMLTDNVEVMARDRKTGLYNFYILGKDKAGSPQVARIFRNDDGTVYERTLAAGAKHASQAGATEAKCFSCHVNGGPFMNEMRDPWTNWISFKKSTALTSVSGTTAQLVSEAVPDHRTGRSSLANDLEPIMRSGIRAFVSGEGAETGAGFAPRTASKAGGVAQLLDSAFCETELNYASSTDAVPMEVYLDPDMAWGDLITPTGIDSIQSPFQMPIRSEFDHSVERWLEDHGYLTRSLTQAIRLLDDENDIFSDVRCQPYRATLRAKLAAAGTPSPEATRQLVSAHLAERAAQATFKTTHPKRFALLQTLLEANPGGAAPDFLRNAYAEELATRFPLLLREPQRLATREVDRKQRAVKMFPDTKSNPLPLLTQRAPAR